MTGTGELWDGVLGTDYWRTVGWTWRPMGWAGELFDGPGVR